MSQHTPGPWRFNPVGEVRGADWNVVVCDTYGNGDDDVADADARLIAAAPDLLAACEAWLSGETTWSTTQAYEMAAHAVAKAKGKALREHIHAQNDEQRSHRSEKGARQRNHAEKPASDC